MYLVHRRGGWPAQNHLWRLVQDSAITITHIPGSQHEAIAQLMKRYRDAPMDLADATLVKLCTDPGQADYIFAVSRDRFARRGRFASLRAAYAKASAAAPDGPAVRDYGRYEQLCAGMPVDPDETAASLAAHPTDVDHRMTHALALLRAGRAGDAWAVFDDFTVFYHELSPGHQAVIAAIAAAKGDHALAVQAARKIDVNMLAPGEYLLVGELRAERP